MHDAPRPVLLRGSRHARQSGGALQSWLRAVRPLAEAKALEGFQQVAVAARRHGQEEFQLASVLIGHLGQMVEIVEAQQAAICDQNDTLDGVRSRTVAGDELTQFAVATLVFWMKTHHTYSFSGANSRNALSDVDMFLRDG